HTRLLVRTRGRPSWGGPRLRFLVLETTGRRSGLARQVVLLFMPDGDAFVVLASNYGSERPPAWWCNLETRPAATVHVGGRTVAVRARALAGAERESLLPRVRAWNGLWRGYLATLRRELPVVRLEPLTTAPTRPG
ncbi:MAG TPA: nitroreductase family deazaflavin-dependent oxidoreductase, partial [Acidimicrobiales bacterium]|nr:nitroreductase family deazaflavin-dependent oxidoreductase [Acidimicrobiales bacterium]